MDPVKGDQVRIGEQAGQLLQHSARCQHSTGTVVTTLIRSQLLRPVSSQLYPVTSTTTSMLVLLLRRLLLPAFNSTSVIDHKLLIRYHHPSKG